MYKVVIIDDESIIAEGLNRVVEWERYDCEVAALASDARTGRDAIIKYKPDIVFTDIKMPDEDGLSMLSGLKSEFGDMQITVLTGYRDFEYARRAIELGVARFLLKPSKMDELHEALEYMTKALDKSRGKEEKGPPSDAAGSFLVRKAVEYIAAHSSEKLSLSEVADRCYVSQWHLSKLLNKHLGLSFYEILNRERVTKAKELLEDPSMRISEIAERVGYADTAHFSRVFKKSENISANEYRNRHC